MCQFESKGRFAERLMVGWRLRWVARGVVVSLGNARDVQRKVLRSWDFYKKSFQKYIEISREKYPEVEISREKCSEVEISREKYPEVEISREKCSEVEISREKYPEVEISREKCSELGICSEK